MILSDSASRLAALRALFAPQQLDGFLVPMEDAYQSEYPPPDAKRIAFLSGFTGSGGFIIVLKDRAAFFTDSRYTLQAQTQITPDLFEIFDTSVCAPSAWMEKNLSAGLKLGYDPDLHTDAQIDRFEKACQKISVPLVPVAENLVDAVWTDRPAPPCAPVVPYPLLYAGKPHAEKRAAVAATLVTQEIGAALLCAPASIAWLLNVRGGDVPHTPLPLSRAILYADGTVLWFLDPRKETDALTAHLGAEITRRPPEAFAESLAELARSGKKILLDPAQTPRRIVEGIRAAGGVILASEDPCDLPRALKNPTELDGMRAAHRRDGAALTRFLAWLETHARGLGELGIESKLETLRASYPLFREPSFDTIAGAGPHGAIIHYRATPESEGFLQDGQLLLLDSGAQYLDGTTDVTRTVAIGKPSAEMKDRYTRVLKGHIALSSIRFPEGTTGGELEVLARQYLWEAGLDYGHSTGHGVGTYLGVHEGPQGISRRNKVALQPGMVVSNEPGFYKAGAYGIRIENLQAVVEVMGLNLSERKMLGFEPLTLVPYDQNLIDFSFLTRAELDWLNAYHRRVRTTLRPLIETEEERAWLEKATTEVSGGG